MRRVLIILFLINAVAISAQQSNLNAQLIKVSFTSEHKVEKRKLLSFKNKRVKYNPLNYVGAALLYAYQNLISEQLQAECTYVTSCSEYTKLSIQKQGFIVGALKGFNQLSECHPSAIYEHPELFIDGRKIINQSDAKD